jgi:hypothetical protein
MPHLYDLALVSKRVDEETNMLTKKLGDNAQSELLHNLFVYQKAVPVPYGPRLLFVHGDLEEVVEVKMETQDWVEMHVDFLDVRKRQMLYPFWGGAISQRCDLTKVFVSLFN